MDVQSEGGRRERGGRRRRREGKGLKIAKKGREGRRKKERGDNRNKNILEILVKRKQC